MTREAYGVWEEEWEARWAEWGNRLIVEELGEMFTGNDGAMGGGYGAPKGGNGGHAASVLEESEWCVVESIVRIIEMVIG